MKECNYCKAKIKEEYVRCPKCGKELVKTNKLRLFIWQVTVVLIAILILIIFFVTKGKIVESHCNQNIITLNDVQNELLVSHESAISKYNDNYYTVNAIITNIYHNNVFDRYIEVKDTQSSNTIYVKFELTSRAKLSKKSVGDNITFCGKLNLTSSEYKFTNATILK